MSAETSIIYPEKIWVQMVEKFEKKTEKMEESDKKFYTDLLNPGITLKAEIPEINKFLDSIKNKTLKLKFIDLIVNFEDYDVYKRFLASILVYNRINNLPDDADKFLYLCIAVEAAMHSKSNEGKEKNKLFRSFFNENLSSESKLKMISQFKNKKVKNVINGSNLANHKTFGSKIKKTKSNGFLPSCYRQKECFIAGGKCYPERLCNLKNKGEKEVNEQLDFILRYLYGKRSRFVHEGVAFALESREKKDYLGGGLLDSYEDHTRNKNYQVFFTLYMEDLFIFYEEALLNYCKR